MSEPHLQPELLPERTPADLMTPDEVTSLAVVSSIFLAVWEILNGHWQGAVLGMLACLSVVYLTREVGAVFSIILALPVVFEERWNPRAEKDMVRAVLAAGIIAPSVANLLLN